MAGSSSLSAAISALGGMDVEVVFAAGKADLSVDRGVGLPHDPTTVDVATVRTSVERLLGAPAFAAAREVSAEMARQPSPSLVIERLTGALP
jgi:UDP:flavonoid glycosyltransferase YjiC (YdhE family)